MGATRKHSNRNRNRTRGSQQYKLARRYVEREITQQINAQFSGDPRKDSVSINHLPFRCHPQFGWCDEVLFDKGFTSYQSPVGSYSRIKFIVPR